MRNYEIAVIFHPDLDEAALAAQVEKVDGWIAADGGSVVRTDRWGKRRLAYEIRKKREGYYIFWYAMLPPALPQQLERNLRLTEDVLRFMVTRLEIMPEPPVTKEAPPAAEEPAPAADVEPEVDVEALAVDEPANSEDEPPILDEDEADVTEE